MPNLSIDIGTGFYQSDALPFANQRCVNLYPNFPQSPALKSSSLFNVPGIREIANTGRKSRDKNRGGWVFNGVPYVVNNNDLYRVDRHVNFDESVTYSSERIATIEGQGFCSFADNGQQLIIINNEGIGYIYQPSGTPQFQVINDAGFYASGTPQQVVFVDSYFVVTTDEKKAIISAPLDGLDWNSLDTITAEADPDAIVAPFVFRNQLYLLGTQTTETYQNIGGAGVPFQRIGGFVLSQGCSAPFSVKQLGDNIYWVGKGENEQPAVYQFNGSTPVKISTTAIDNKLHELSSAKLESIYTWAYSLRGNEFIAFTSDDFTFVYDNATQRWHERVSNLVNGRGVRVDKPCRIRCVLNAYNELLVGDSEDGRIGVVDVGRYKEYEEPLISFFTTTPLYDLGNSFSLPRIELLAETGVGTKEIRQPEVRLEISRNGATFEDPRTQFLGNQGNRDIRPIWYKNGRVSRYCIMKVTVSDPVKRRFFALEISYKQGTRNG